MEIEGRCEDLAGKWKNGEVSGYRIYPVI